MLHEAAAPAGTDDGVASGGFDAEVMFAVHCGFEIFLDARGGGGYANYTIFAQSAGC